MFEYIYPKSVIRPKAAYGIIYYYDKEQSMNGLFMIGTAMGGFNIRLSDSISLSLEYNVDFGDEIFFIFPQHFVSHSFLGGFHFRF